ncbi:hypothetical protein T440DRAFT_452685 [Plenodomus tracheiphilus IPT5]|uniref:Uncharacterized protein n=1 Tax=Plenodomus tracheiphilus IPT5 TaxID=1408161 RepID=A0A6A7B4S3_9PLEO|nr:hypothetical protein T440DRAFT_452685 [Plenodomus tracheiphilus IPT5]
MRRPPIACQRAVQSLQSPPLQHIWISDDQLSLAVNRFFRTTCPHQKRHGSNVPGPLEARRRAAKRRMTVSAGFYPQENFSPSFNLSAWFGFRRNPQPSWQYQPPSLRKDAAPVPDSLRPPDTTSMQSTYDPLLEPTNPAHYPDSAHDPQMGSYEVARTITKELEANFRDVALDHETMTEVDLVTVTRDDPAMTMSGDIEACFELFKSSIAQPNSMDYGRLVTEAFELSCPPGTNAWIFNNMVIKHLLDLNWDPSPLLALAQERPLQFTLPPIYTTAHHQLLDYAAKMPLVFPDCNRQLHGLYMRLAKAAAGAESSANSAQDAELITLCRGLWQSSHALGSELGNSVLNLVCTVASKVQNQHTAAMLRPVLAQNYSKDGPKHALMQLVLQACISRGQYLAAVDVLRCMPRVILLDVIPMYTLYLSRAQRKTRAAASMHKERWDTWLTLINSAGRETDLDSTGLNAAIEPLAQAIFYNNPRKSLARHSSDCIRPGNLLHTLLFKFAVEDAKYAMSKTAVAQTIDSALLSISTQREILRPETVLVKVIVSLKKASLPHCEFTDAIVAFLARHGNLNALVTFMTMVRDHGLGLGETSVVDALVRQKTFDMQQQAAPLTDTQLQHNALTLHNCQVIASILRKIASVSAIKHERVSPTTFKTLRVQRQLRHILSRADAARALPLAFRNLSADMTLEDRIALIHQLAHEYSLDKTRTQREVWRAIYYLYRHLKEYSLSIGPLFSRAVVRISIIRPLSEQRFVSARRMIWVCHLVARVEGEAVAKKIESDFWQWRGDLIKHAKHVHNSIGADTRQKAHVGNMKRLGLI